MAGLEDMGIDSVLAQGAGYLAMLIGILFFIIIGAVAYYAWTGKIKIPMLMKYPIRVIILVKRGNGVVPEEDRATRWIDAKTKRETYLLKHNKKEIQAFAFSNILPGNLLILFSPAAGEFHPVNLIERKDSLEFEPILDESVKYVYADTMRQNLERYKQQSWLEKYLPVVMFGMAIMGVIMLFYVTNTQITATAGALSNVATQLGRIANQLGATNPDVIAAVGATPTPAIRPPFG